MCDVYACNALNDRKDKIMAPHKANSCKEDDSSFNLILFFVECNFHSHTDQFTAFIHFVKKEI